MTRTKSTKTDEAVEEVKTETTETSQAYNLFKAHIEAYAKNNPTKYEAKKKELEAKLKAKL